jgi:hypothetical protein
MDKEKSWDVLTDFLKTIITISIAFITFTATFSENLYNPKIESIPLFLLLSWIGNIITIFLAMFSVAKISSFLYDAKKPNIPVGLSNISFFVLLISIILFLAFIITKPNKYQVEFAEKQVMSYLENYDPIFANNSKIVSKELSPNNIWIFTLVNSTDTLIIELDKENLELIKLKKLNFK